MRSRGGPERVLSSAATSRRWRVACNSSSSCGAARSCDRVVLDDWASAVEVDALKAIAVRGMAAASADGAAGGPTIFDMNSGYVMAPGARLVNLYSARDPQPIFSQQDYELYRQVIRRLKRAVEQKFALDPAKLHFTAPTFITRLSGRNASWRPSEPHDEYWHEHVDRANTQHYEYSGLLYLSDFRTDFQGGLFAFEDHLEIEPRRGRLLLFASSDENAHGVRRVTEGERFVLSRAHDESR